MVHRLVIHTVLFAGLFIGSLSQPVLAQQSRPDAAALLLQIKTKYIGAKEYHIEAMEEWQRKNDFSTMLNRSLLSAIGGTDKRFRYEAHTGYGRALKVSDNKTETLFNPDSNEYTQRSLAERQAPSPLYQWQIALQDASGLLIVLSRVGNELIAPVDLPDEELTIAGKNVTCYVIKGKVKYGGGTPETTGEATYWVEKDNLLIRKKYIHYAGMKVISSDPATEDRTTIYTVMELGPGSAPDSSFAFQPPAEAKLIKEFRDPYQPKDQLAGIPAPDVKFPEVAGKSETLREFHGKPVLLDFWATWCAPCVAELGQIKKIQEENAAKGLVVIGIDENEPENAEIGKSFLAQHGVTWTNYHDDGEIWRAFPSNRGIPYFVLIDANGQIVFAKPNADETELRIAIAKLQNLPGK